MQSVIKRPLLLSIVCILGFIWVLFSFVVVFSPSIKKLGDWYPALFGLIVASCFMSYIGLLNMKKWGAQLFVITFFIKEVILIIINDVSYVGIVFSVFFMVTMAIYYKRMDSNL
jgi:hypothetical protein